MECLLELQHTAQVIPQVVLKPEGTPWKQGSFAGWMAVGHWNWDEELRCKMAGLATVVAYGIA